VTHVITEACIGSTDESCVAVCPVDCIYEVGRMFVIHPEECIDCGACVPECPVEAIFLESDLPQDQQPFVAVNSAIVRGVEAADGLLAAHVNT
jgi:NAD-dependent dihydropyrimidine dehydrogenase PreA subunit